MRDLPVVRPPKMEGEEWRPVIGYEGLYEVSSLGRVWSCGRVRKIPVTATRRAYEQGCRPRLLNPTVNDRGRRVVHFTDADGVHRNRYVYRLVAQAFVENPEGKREVNHLDGCRTNDRAENLEWCTRRENVEHALANGLMGGSAANNPAVKLDEAVVRKMRRLAAEDRPAAIALGVSRGVAPDGAARAIDGRTWKRAGD